MECHAPGVQPVRIGFRKFLGRSQVRFDWSRGVSCRLRGEFLQNAEKSCVLRQFFRSALKQRLNFLQLRLRHAVFRTDFRCKFGNTVPIMLIGKFQICFVIIPDDRLRGRKNRIRLHIHPSLLDELQQNTPFFIAGIADQRQKRTDPLFVILFAEHGNFACDTALHRKSADDIEEKAVQRTDLQFLRRTEDLPQNPE